MASVGHLTGLHQIKLVKNTTYVRSGRKSYGHLLRKFEITPTLPTPFTIVHDLIDDGATKFLNRFKPGVHIGHGHTVTHMVRRDTSGKIGEVQAEDIQQDSEYLAQVALWSTKLPKETIKTGHASGHNIFDPSKSSTWKDIDSTWQIRYGDGSTAQGVVGNDIVNIGGIQLVNQGVELAKNLSPSFVASKGDGLLGLAFGSINTVQPTPVKTPVENMAEQSDIPKDAELFTAYLTNSKDNIPPCYTFGYIDQDLVNGGTINYAPVDSSQGFWSVESTSASINGQNYSLAGNTAIIDTGTTLALIDDNTCKAVYDTIPGSKYDADQGGFLFPSSTLLEQLPVIKFAIGETFLTLHKDDISYVDAGNGMTYGGIQSRGNLAFNIFGDTCLKGMYAIFDQGNRQFGYVQKPDMSTRSGSGSESSPTQYNVARQAPAVANPKTVVPATAPAVMNPPTTPAAVGPTGPATGTSSTVPAAVAATATSPASASPKKHWDVPTTGR